MRFVDILSAKVTRVRGGVRDYLLSGGRFRRGVADYLHGAVFALRPPLDAAHTAETRMLSRMRLRNRVALDVGAHAGSWTRSLARAAGPVGLVIAYEAFPHYGKALAISLRLLRLKNVRVRAVAVGDAERTVNLRWRSDSGDFLSGRTHVELGEQKTRNVVQVHMVSLDQDLKSYRVPPHEVGFVKIDVEGAELEVLRGASNLLKEGRPAVYLEVEPTWITRMSHSVQEVFNEMSMHGYLPYLLSEIGMEPTDVDSYLMQYEGGGSTNGGSLRRNNVLFLHETSLD